MPEEEKDTRENIVYRSVYESIEDEYKKEWLKEGTTEGFLADTGIAAKNRWEQFEASYRANYAAYSQIYMSEEEFQARLVRRYQEEEAYYAANGTPADERKTVFSDQETYEKACGEIRQEMEEYAQRQAGDSAALAAFETVGGGTFLISQKDRVDKTEAALKESNQGKNKAIQDELANKFKEKAGNDPEYLVRGAPIRCQYGSHMRYLDMQEGHGVYLNDKPVGYRMDCEGGINIMPFGICTSPVHDLRETGSLLAGAETDREGNYLRAPEERVVTGALCDPKPAEGWENCKSETMIAKDAAPGMKDLAGCTYYEALTTASYLICEHGGLIFPLGSGQLEYSAYMSPYSTSPLSECPHRPGTKEYMKWHRDRIDTLKDEKASDKKIRAAYEDCLDEAFLYGLDLMDGENQDAVRAMAEEYAGSEFLKEQDAEEIRKKYAGLRLDYGFNTQKNLVNATPEQDGFYRYYRQEIKEFGEKEKELREKLREANTTGEQTIVATAAGELRKFLEEKEKIQGYFIREIERYDGYLDEERQKQVQEIKELFEKGAKG